MNQAIRIGPLVLPPSLLLVVLAVGIALLVGNRMARKSGAEAEGSLYRILLAGLIVARLAFVFEYRSAYLNAPWGILDIRDGGWSPQAGLVGAWLYAMSRVRRLPEQRRPVLSALAAASAVWIAGAVLMAVSVPDTRPLPEFAAASLDGNQVALPDFTGKPTVINLWATWCPPCRREMPVLERAQRERPDVHFVFLNQGEAAATVRRFLDRSSLSLHHVLLDPDREIARLFKQSALPTTLFFDADGRLAGIRIGELSDATLAQRLDTLTPGKTPAAR